MPEYRGPIKIISGGQRGADVAGLRAGKALGLMTGGCLPAGCLTLDGPKPQYLEVYGCHEHILSDYPPRTRENVRNADATVRFAFDFETRGEKCTFNAIREYSKPLL